MERETLWFEHALGASSPRPAPWVLRPPFGDSSQPEPVPLQQLIASPGPPADWPSGLWREARGIPFPHAGLGVKVPDRAAALVRLAAHTVSLVRRDPADPFNDHRAYASPRCLYPVVACVVVAAQWHVLDPERRVVVPTGVSAGDLSEGAIALTGRWDAIPSAYGWFRGSLVALETGIVLRHLAILARLYGLTLSVTPPAAGWQLGALASLWREPDRWAPPWVVTPDDSVATEQAGGESSIVPDPEPDATRINTPSRLEDCWGDMVRTYSGQTLECGASALGDGLPAHGADSADTWADVCWRRSAGRMPRGLHGFRVAPGPLSCGDLEALLAWAAPPAPLAVPWEGVRLRAHAVVRNVEGLVPGVHTASAQGLQPRSGTELADADRFAQAYLYASDPTSRNDMPRAPLVLVITYRPRELVRRLGVGGWVAGHLAAGWLAHGICVGAASRRLVARPVRALDEKIAGDVLELEDDEMVGLAVVVSRHLPHGGFQIDLRS